MGDNMATTCASEIWRERVKAETRGVDAWEQRYGPAESRFTAYEEAPPPTGRSSQHSARSQVSGIGSSQTMSKREKKEALLEMKAKIIGSLVEIEKATALEQANKKRQAAV